MVQRSTPHALGTVVLRESPAGFELVNDTLIPENSDIPASGEKTYAIRAGQTDFQVPVLEMDCHLQERELLGNYCFAGLPARPAEAPIRVRFEYGADKVPVVLAWDVQSGRALQGKRCRSSGRNCPTPLPQAAAR